MAPSVKIAYYGNSPGVWRPYCKINALFSLMGHFVGAHFLIDLVMVTLPEEILVQLANLIGL